MSSSSPDMQMGTEVGPLLGPTRSEENLVVPPPGPPGAVPEPPSTAAPVTRNGRLPPVAVPAMASDPDEEAAGFTGASSPIIAAGLTEKELAEYQESYPWMGPKPLLVLCHIFEEWDENKSGELSCEQMGEILRKVVREIFDQIDDDNNGSLDKSEVSEYMDRLGLSLPQETLNRYFMEMRQGKSGPGEVTFDEFNLWWEGFEKGDVSQDELKDLFDEVDEDGSGMIDIGEFITMIARKMEGKDMDGKTGIQMVRMALDIVRDDVRAIYGTTAKPRNSQKLFEYESNQPRRCCFFMPNEEPLQYNNRPPEGMQSKMMTNFRRLWDAMQVFLLGYVAIAVPYRMGFAIEIMFDTGWFWFEAIVDVYFAFDILINFRTAFATEDGGLITSTHAIAKRYIKGWFWIDVAACFPVTYIGLLVGGTDSSQRGAQQLKVLKIVRLFRLAKMLRLARIQRVIKRLDEDLPGLWTVSRLTSLVMIILYISHLIACFWYAVGLTEQTLPTRNGTAGKLLEGWVIRDGLHDWDVQEDDTGSYTSPVGWGTRYLDAYYFAITTLTTVGYGDRTPETDSEKLFSVFTELAGGMIFGILAGTLSSMIAEANQSANEIAMELDEIRNFMLAKKVPLQLRRDIMTKMEIYARGGVNLDEHMVLDKLPPKFRKVLLLQMYKPQLMACPLFLGLDDSIITKLAIVMQSYLAVIEDVVVQENSVGDELYMIISGEVSITSKTISSVSGKTWTDGAFFGELPMLELGNGKLKNLHVYSVVATTESEMAYLRRHDVEMLERDYPKFDHQIRQLARKRGLRFGLDMDEKKPPTSKTVDPHQSAASAVGMVLEKLVAMEARMDEMHAEHSSAIASLAAKVGS